MSVRPVGSATSSFWMHLDRSGLQDTIPAVGGGRIFAVGGGQVFGFSLTPCGQPACTPVWETGFDREFDTEVIPVVTGDGSTVFVATGVGPETVAIDAATGTEQWRVPGTPVALAGDTLFVAAPSAGDPSVSTLQAYDAGGCGQTTCPPLWSTEAGATGLPAIAGSVLYAGHSDTVQVYAAGGCGAAECPPLATVDLPEGTHAVSRIVVAEGQLYVVTGDALTAFAPDGEAP